MVTYCLLPFKTAQKHTPKKKKKRVSAQDNGLWNKMLPSQLRRLTALCIFSSKYAATGKVALNAFLFCFLVNPYLKLQIA